MCPKLAGPAKPALNLVKDEQGASLITQFPQTLQEGLRGHVNAALALNRLHNDCCRLPLHKVTNHSERFKGLAEALHKVIVIREAVFGKAANEGLASREVNVNLLLGPGPDTRMLT